MKTKLPMMLAVLALIISTLACSLGGGEPTLSNSRAAFDSDGVNITSTFGLFDTVYVVSDLDNGVAGNLVSSDWYAESVDGLEANFFIDTVEYTVVDESFNGTVHFFFEPPDGGWPTGTYRVEVSFNGVPTATVRFTIQ